MCLLTYLFTYSTPLETAGIITVEMILHSGQISHGNRGCLSWVRWGPRSGGYLAGCWFPCVDRYIALLVSLLGMSEAAPSTRLMRALNLREPVHDLANARGHEWLSQGILSSIRLVAFQGVRKEAVHVTASWL